jgi:hypothetical protein
MRQTRIRWPHEQLSGSASPEQIRLGGDGLCWSLNDVVPARRS